MKPSDWLVVLLCLAAVVVVAGSVLVWLRGVTGDEDLVPVPRVSVRVLP